MLCPSIFNSFPCVAQDLLPSDSAVIPLNMADGHTFPAATVARLQKLLQNKRVVMLGEATHGEGEVQEMKTALVKLLHQTAGYNTLAFESGFYDLYKANNAWKSGLSLLEVVQQSIFSVWGNSRQCQALWQYLDQQRSNISLIGFDPQLSGEYGKNLVADLEEYYEQREMSNAPDFDLLENVVRHMSTQYSFPPTESYTAFEKEIKKAIGALSRGTGDDSDFWQQVLINLQELALDYHQHNPSARNATTFKASDSNPRDRQMALNLLFHLKRNPGSKVICWGATTHFMNNPQVLQNEELNSYVSMGKIVKDAMGEQVYIIGFTAGAGSYGIFGKNVLGLQPAAASLEQKLRGNNSPAAFISLQQFSPMVFTSQVIEHQPLTGPWKKVLDGIVYLPTVSPSGYYTAATSDTAGSMPRATTPVTHKIPVKKVIGKVVSKEGGSPVPFASIYLRGAEPATLISNNEGLFEWPASRTVDSAIISCIGYQTLRKSAEALSARDTMIFQMSSQAGMLQTVVVTAPEKDPYVVIRKVIDKRPANLPGKDFTIRMYVHEILKEKKDTLRDVEYITNIFSQNGYSADHSVRSGLQAVKWNKKQQDSSFQKTGAVLNMANTTTLKSFSRIDYLYDLPLFTDRKKIRSYQLSLDSITYMQDDPVYVISFASKRTSERYTFSFNTARFSGVVYINSRNYAVLRYNVTTETDTLRYNANARRFFNKPVFENDKYFWSLLKTADRVDKSVIYAPLEGIYIPVYASLIQRQTGESQLGKMPVDYGGSAEFFLYDFGWGTAGSNAYPETNLYKFSKAYDPVFWNNLVKPFSNVY